MPTPAFILDLRQHIGNDLLWLSAVTAVIFDDDGRVLLHQRSDNGAWSLICGILEPGEQPADAAVREAWEEAAVHIEIEQLASVTVGAPFAFVNGDEVQFLDITFRCRAVGGEARVNDDESMAVGWFRPTELPPLDDDMRARLAHALADTPSAWFAPPSPVRK
jgi:8-oxo-dGTP pyrophosphatase MutT (NUDIX family)